MKSISKFTAPVVVNETSLPSQAPVAPARERKPRAPRTHRVFNYRGIRFFLVAHGMETMVSILNPETNQPEPKLTVAKENALKAAQALATIILKERYLNSL